METTVIYNPESRELRIEQDGRAVCGASGDIAENKLIEILSKNEYMDYKVIINDSGEEKKRLIRRLHAIVHAKGIADEYYRDLLSSYGVVTSTDLNIQQLERLCQLLNKDVAPIVAKRRKIVLSLLHQLGVEAVNGDFSHVNSYLCDSRIAGKELYKLNADELQALQTKLRLIIRKTVASNEKSNK